MKIEYKGCSGGLLSLDGQLTPEGEVFMKRQQSSVEFKVVNPPDSRVSAMHQRANDIQQSIDRMKRQSHVEPNHPVVVRGLRLLARRAEHGTASRT